MHKSYQNMSLANTISTKKILYSLNNNSRQMSVHWHSRGKYKHTKNKANQAVSEWVDS